MSTATFNKENPFIALPPWAWGGESCAGQDIEPLSQTPSVGNHRASPIHDPGVAAAVSVEWTDIFYRYKYTYESPPPTFLCVFQAFSSIL